jgi:3-methyladenine DNA glycosylase AlkC
MEPFKNLLNENAVIQICRALKRVDPKFPSEAFLKGIQKELEPLELKQRVILIQSKLSLHLPADRKKSFHVLQGALKQDSEDLVGVSGFLVWPFTQYVMEHGLDDFELSMKALHSMTQVFTAEFAIRPFLIRHEDLTLKRLSEWIDDESEHVRRLVSEGTRPLLPWGQRLPQFIKYPELTWPFLERLKHDSSEYVRKSVANHINDHSKNHGDWVVKKLKKWKKEENLGESVHWIIRHGTRTLVKQGHLGALSLHGVEEIEFKNIKVKLLNKEVRIGEVLEVRFKIRNPLAKKVKVIVDSQILFLKSNGKHSPKVFKGKVLTLEAEESVTLELRIPLKQVTTRKYYVGKQGYVLLINGIRQKELWFNLCKSST